MRHENIDFWAFGQAINSQLKKPHRTNKREARLLNSPYFLQLFLLLGKLLFWILMLLQSAGPTDRTRTSTGISMTSAADFIFFLSLHNYLDRLASIPRTDGLTALSVRWIHPIQQHGRRFPSLSWCLSLVICSFLVSSFFTNVTQQIHSFRASGVRFSHAANTTASDTRTFRISKGTACTVPPESAFWGIYASYTSPPRGTTRQ
jgi:hypothetical protein